MINETNRAAALNGTIVKGIAGFYYVKSGVAVYRCKARGIFKQRGIKPAVGDNVTIEIIPDNDDSVIVDITERKNSFVRPFVANVDCFAVVTAALRPAPILQTIDRFLVMAEKTQTDIVICINKCDLAENTGSRKNKSSLKAAENIQLLNEIYGSLYPVVCTDCVSGTGFDKLKDMIKGRKTALAGPSGTGKSTILNRLIPHAGAETGEISEKSQRGRHTTRHSELFTIDDRNGTMIFDTPGFTSFDVIEADEHELQHFFPEIAEHLGKCRYSDCMHIAEPGCAVRNALEKNEISRSRYESYVNMIDEIKKSGQY